MTTIAERLANNTVSHCPMHGGSPVTIPLVPGTRLVFPLHQRVVAQYADSDEGTRELRLFYQDQEISFDEPDLFRFGETLAKTAEFLAGEACQWGGPHSWELIKDLLESLLSQGILQIDTGGLKPHRVSADRGNQPSPLQPAPAAEARSWNECPQIMQSLGGRSLELAYLELVVPIFRVAHMSLDQEGRQVGEANVFPPALRIEVPTNWRTCIYSGTRYLSDRPMNVSALKSMRAHWGQMMHAVARIRAAYLDRFPQARAGWTVGHLERLSTLVLAVPTYQVMKCAGANAAVPLHPALSSLFRVTDGVRMTMHQMLFVPIGEPSLSPDTPMSSQQIYDYAERNYSFHSEHGVCAGPQAMVLEFLSVLVDGAQFKGAEDLVPEAAVSAALAEIDSAFEYAMLGLQAYAAVFSLWPAMVECYERLAEFTHSWQAPAHSAELEIAGRFAAHVQKIRESSYLGTQERRDHRITVYDDMYAQCALGQHRADARAAAGPRLSDRIAQWSAARNPANTSASLCQALALTADLDDVSATRTQPLFQTIADFLKHAQGVLGVAAEVQGSINTLLGRAAARQDLSLADLDLHNALQAAGERRLPFLLDELAGVLGLQISVTKDRITIRSSDSSQAPEAPAVPPFVRHAAAE